jgi:hypothetical protein
MPLPCIAIRNQVCKSFWYEKIGIGGIASASMLHAKPLRAKRVFRFGFYYKT